KIDAVENKNPRKSESFLSTGSVPPLEAALPHAGRHESGAKSHVRADIEPCFWFFVPKFEVDAG
ncbi:MAG: hypothetical protein SOY05_05660, partial [Ellagibacter isourolithinifaciens]|nr:hypothetical protein [Ellagibacter isourolithinifaciens]